MRAMYIFHAITSATKHSCYYHFALASTDQQQLENMRDYLKKVVQEDMEASETIEKLLTINGEPEREVIKFSDHNSIRARRQLQKMMAEES